jgi:hypothetical protein
MARVLIGGLLFAAILPAQEQPPLPQIFAPGDLQLSNDSGRCSASGLVLGIPKATDSAGGHTIEAVRNDGEAIAAPYPVGTTTVTWTVTDKAGQTAETVQRIVVKDSEPPGIKAPPDIEVGADDEGPGTSVNEGAPVVTGGCSSYAITARRSDGREFRMTDEQHPRYPTGFTTVKWTVTDDQGRHSSATQQIMVREHMPPRIEAPPDVAAHTDQDRCGAFVNIGTPTLAGKCSRCSIVAIRSDGKRRVDMPFPLGRTTIIWTATNISGMTASAEQEVVVSDREGPVIGDVTVKTDGLWPANGRMVGVRLRYDAKDLCEGEVRTSLRVTTNQPRLDNAPDWEVINDHFVDLRAESTGSGERVYTIVIEAMDAVDNQSTKSVMVRVRPPD